jgi:CRP/FNR family cyclic AMP-dependent transcriptional regulator
MTIETFEKTLGSHPFFADLDAPHLKTIVGCTANVVFDAGEFIFREGTPTDRFYVLREGKVAVEVAAAGRGALTIETLDAGEVLGWSWLFPPYVAHFDARAVTRVRALSLDGACLRRKCESDVALGYDLIRRFAGVLIQRLEATRIQLMDVYGQ